VEHKRYIIENLPELNIQDETADKLLSYAESICSASASLNLTGHKTLDDIVRDLIVGSLIPFAVKYVPRGTYFLDIGTGAGVPGIPYSIVFNEIRGLLLDSNSKKITFIEGVIQTLGLKNIEAVSLRAEEAAREEKFRETFSMVMSRAMASMYMMAELSTGFLKPEGILCLHSRDEIKSQPVEALEHAENCGLVPCDAQETISSGIRGCILLKKINICPDRFPRRYAVIKRESDRIYADKKSSPENIPLL